MPTPGFKNRIASAVVPVVPVQGGSGSAAIAEGVTKLAGTVGQVAQQQLTVREQVADSDARLAVAEHNRQIAAATAVGFGTMAKIQDEAASKLEQARRATAPGAVGYEETSTKIIADAKSSIIQSLPDEPEIMQRFGPLLDEWEVRQKSSERDFAADDWRKHQGAQIEQWQTLKTNALRKDDQLGPLDEYFNGLDVLLDSQDMSGTTREVLKRRMRQDGVMAKADGMIERGNFAPLQAALEHGVFDEWGIDTEALSKHLGIAVRQQEAQDRAQASTLKSQLTASLTDNISALDVRIAAGEDVPQTALASVHDQAVALGDKSAATKLEIWGLQVSANRALAGKTPSQKRAMIADYRSRNAAGQLPGKDQIVLRQWEKRQDDGDEKAAAPFKAEWAQGGQARTKVVGDLFTMPPEQRVALAAKIDTSGALQNAVQLDRGPAVLAVTGAESLKADRKAYPDDEKFRARFAAEFAGVPHRLNDTGIAAVRETATQIYAAMQSEQGFDPKTVNETGFRAALNLALGRDGRGGGGIGSYRGAKVLLPSGVSAKGFETFLSRFDFSGTQEQSDTVKRDYRPMWLGDDGHVTSYQMVNGAGEVLFGKDNTPYVIHVRAKQ